MVGALGAILMGPNENLLLGFKSMQQHQLSKYVGIVQQDRHEDSPG